MKKDLTLVLNLGLKSIRAVIFSETGEILEKESRPVTTYVSGDVVEQDAIEWQSKAREVIAKVLIDETLQARIGCMTVSGSASCLVPVDSKGTPLSKVLMVSDKRASLEAEEIAAHPLFASVHEKTRLTPHPSLMLEKALWLKRHRADAYAESCALLSPNDFFIHWLTGQFVTDTYNALKCQAFAESSTESLAYPKTFMESLGLDVARFPRIERPGTTLGPLLSERAKELGLPADTEVVLATYDALCAFWGSGATEPGDACDVSGTVTSLRVLTPIKADRQVRNLYVLPALVGGWEIVGGSNNLGGGLIEWTKQTFYPDDSHPYETMEMEARQSPLGARGLIFLPYLLGERAPLWDENIRGNFFGIERAHKRADFARAIFESAGFSLLWLLQEIQASGVEIAKIKASGGVTQIPFVSQLKADILGKEIHVVDVFESTSLGAFFYAKAKHDGARLQQLVRSCVAVREIIKPQMARHEKYLKLFALYQDLYRTLKPFAVQRKALLKELGFDKLESIENL